MKGYTMTTEQRDRIIEIYHRPADRPISTDMTIDELIASAQTILGTNDNAGRPAVGVQAWGMMIGIEPDGYAHT